jgi:hypothetical protein
MVDGAWLLAVQEALTSFGYKVLGGDDRDVRFQLRTQSRGRYRAQWLLNPEEQVARLIAHLDTQYPAPRAGYVAELVHRLDCEIGILGSFGLHYDTGGIFLRYGLHFRNGSPVAADLRAAMNTLAFPVAAFEAARPFIESASNASPAEVVSAVMLMTGSAEEHAYISKAAKKLAFTLIK